MRATWKKPGAVVVCSREQAQRYLTAAETRRDIEAVVSLGGTRPHGISKIPDTRKLVLTFGDYEREPTKEEIACGLGFQAPSFHDVVLIRDFLESRSAWFNTRFIPGGSYRRIIFHCEQGIFRSSAAALIGFAMFSPNKDAQLAVEMLIEHSEEEVCPNKLIVRHADDLLEYRGGLIRAVDNMWRGGRGNTTPKFT